MPANKSVADVSMSSSALLYCLKNDWGGETLFINGRFEVPEGGSYERFSRWFAVAGANRHGTFYDLGYYTEKLMRLLKRAS
jgi:UDP-MurNAc hydroxylase